MYAKILFKVQIYFIFFPKLNWIDCEYVIHSIYKWPYHSNMSQRNIHTKWTRIWLCVIIAYARYIICCPQKLVSLRAFELRPHISEPTYVNYKDKRIDAPFFIEKISKQNFKRQILVKFVDSLIIRIELVRYLRLWKKII